MLIGKLVKLKSTIKRHNEEDMSFINNAIKEGWIWMVTSTDDEEIDLKIQPLYLEGESYQIELGKSLNVLDDEIELAKIGKKALFSRLNRIRCNFG